MSQILGHFRTELDPKVSAHRFAIEDATLKAVI